MKRQTLFRALLFLALATAIAAAITQRDHFDARGIGNWVASAGAAGPVLYMAIYALATVLFLPGSVLTLAGGAVYGPLWGTFYSLTGATAGATLAFLVARYLASDWVRRRASGWARQLIDGVESEGWRFVAFVRLVPLFPFNLLNYALGLTRIGLLPYVVASYLFMLPGALAYTYLGYAGREALAGGEGLIRKGLLALALLGVVAFLPRLVKRLRRQTSAQQLSTAELKDRLDRGEALLVLDVRSAADFAGAGGHIRGAVNLPLEELAARITELDAWRDRTLAVVCRTNRRSGETVRRLAENGFRRTLLVHDGMLGWEKQGFPTETSTAEVRT